MQAQELGRNGQDDSWGRVNQLRDKFEYDRERRMREKGWFLCVSLILWIDLFLLFIYIFFCD